MWSPADLFKPALNAVTLSMERVTSYFYEHLMVLAAVLLGVAALTAVITMVGGRRRDGAQRR